MYASINEAIISLDDGLCIFGTIQKREARLTYFQMDTYKLKWDLNWNTLIFFEANDFKNGSHFVQVSVS